MLKLEGLTKTFKMGSEEIQAVNDIDLEIKDQAFITIMGRSGSGKSTLLYLMGCLDRPTEGKIIIDGIDVSKAKKKKLLNIRRNKIGFIFQQNNLVPTLNVLENVMLPLKYMRISKRKAKPLAMEMLDKVGLSNRLKHLPYQLSGGEQQRVAIARALVNRPSVVLADEPTGCLDSQTAKEIIHLMREMNEENKQTFVIVTHDPIVAEASDQTYNIQDGKLIDHTSSIQDKKIMLENA